LADMGGDVSKQRIVYEREYDNPVFDDGKKKSNKLLGKFKVLETLSEDMYSEQFIGQMNGKKYIVTEHEVSGYYNPGQGGSRWEMKEVKL
jgi:hypothetical protein